MDNALAPQMQPAMPQDGGAAMPMPQGNALAPQMDQRGGPPQQPQMPAPNHRQVVAALRHFDAIEDELTKLLKSPDCGKADMKSDLIDAATRLVGKGMFTPTGAAGTLADFPQRPFDQKKWLLDHFMQTVQAQHAILDHHGAAFPGQDMEQGDLGPDDQIGVMAGLNNHYADVKKANDKLPKRAPNNG